METKNAHRTVEIQQTLSSISKQMENSSDKMTSIAATVNIAVAGDHIATAL